MNAETTIPLLIFFEGMVGYGGTQICLTGKKQGETVGTGNMGTGQFRKGTRTPPFPPERPLLFLKRILRLVI